MHYVQKFSINGIDTKQVACIELQGRPNAATEGSVGLLAMDMASPTHDVYKCVAVNGNVYTWQLLSAGMSIITATITGEGGASMSFPYSALLYPSNYIVKTGDLILDSEGYVYQITSIGKVECDTVYSGIHLGGSGTSGSDRTLRVENGKLQLVTPSGSVICELDYLLSDNKTIMRDSATGEASVRGIYTINDTLLRIFRGKQAEYDALADSQKVNLFPIITDNTRQWNAGSYATRATPEGTFKLNSTTAPYGRDAVSKSNGCSGVLTLLHDGESFKCPFSVLWSSNIDGEASATLLAYEYNVNTLRLGYHLLLSIKYDGEYITFYDDNYRIPVVCSNDNSATDLPEGTMIFLSELQIHFN